ncbi:MAG: hypothetical protein EA409_12190 [Saprospirales bacterium]|nr:MAG: hypothetical protein EA409_12190 [Saprospirales bacterium]
MRSQNTFCDSKSAFAGKIDPAAEKYFGLTPYNSMANNRFSFNDPDGDDFGLSILIGVGIGILSNGLHNVSNGGLSYVQGGDFWHGFASGGIGSGIGSAIGAHGKAAGWSRSGTNFAMIGGGALSGGIGSSISGGSFWKGFGVAATVGVVNHAMNDGLFGGTDPWEVIRREQHELGGYTEYYADGGSAFHSSGGAIQFYNADGTEGAFFMASGAIRPAVAPWEYLIGGGLASIASGKVFVAGLRYYVGNYAKLHHRIAKDIYMGSNVNAGKRGAAFMRAEIARYGNIRVRNWRTISFNYTTSGGQVFSIGFNPWTRRIIHMSPGR